MVIDTVNDVVIGDCGDKVMSTAGVAVRPFWWSTECLEALGLASAGTGTETTAAGQTSGTSAGGDTTGGDGRTNGEVTGGAGDAGTGDGREALPGGGLSGGWIALIAVLAVIAVAASAGLAFMLGRGRATGTVAAAAPFCPQCGSALNPGAKFCATCGRATFR